MSVFKNAEVTFGEMKEELQIAHLVLHPVKFPPLRGEDDNPKTMKIY